MKNQKGLKTMSIMITNFPEILYNLGFCSKDKLQKIKLIDIAKETGVSVSYISKLYRGRICSIVDKPTSNYGKVRTWCENHNQVLTTVSLEDEYRNLEKENKKLEDDVLFYKGRITELTKIIADLQLYKLRYNEIKKLINKEI